MLSDFACGTCRSVEFQAIVQLKMNSENRVVEVVETGIQKCSNCATRYLIADDGSVTLLEAAPQSSGARPARVRSSVSAAERGKDTTQGRTKF